MASQPRALGPPPFGTSGPGAGEEHHVVNERAGWRWPLDGGSRTPNVRFGRCRMALKFDVVVVGGGLSGGLPTAAYLQKAGLKVAILERHHELATFAPTTDPWPNTIMSPHASINWAGVSPVIEDLELEKYGHRMVFGPTADGTSHKDGTNVLIYHDPVQTAKAIARFSKKDAEVVERLQRGGSRARPSTSW